MNEFFFSPFSVAIVAIVCVFTYRIIHALMHARVRELEVRERIAMIERGLVPPPEKDPQGFDRAMGLYDRYRDRHDNWRRRRPGRFRSAGIMMIGIGLGLTLLIGLSSDNMREAVGVGGFIVLIGLALFVNSLLDPSHDEPASYAPRPPASQPPPQQSQHTQPPSFSGTDPRS